MHTTGIVHQSLRVQFDYPIVFTTGALDPANPALRQVLQRLEPERCHRLLFVVDRGVARAWPDISLRLTRYCETHAAALQAVAPALVLNGGERAKNGSNVVSAVLDAIAVHNLDRHSFVVVIGGGAILDAAGYAASIAHRGVRCVRLPTTVLAQNDAGIGVKTSVNAYDSKNFLGTYAPPFAVVNDFDFLKTLNPRDVVAGFAEAIKVALLRDPRFFDWIEDNASNLARADSKAVAILVRRCAELHAAHIGQSQDAFERSNHKPLDFGHWSAHRLESLSAHNVRHGEAVAIGILIDCHYAQLMGLLEPSDCARIGRIISSVGLPCTHPLLITQSDQGGTEANPSLLEGLDEFRAHMGGDLSLTLLAGIGKPIEVRSIDRARLKVAIRRVGASTCDGTAEAQIGKAEPTDANQH